MGKYQPRRPSARLRVCLRQVSDPQDRARRRDDLAAAGRPSSSGPASCGRGVFQNVWPSQSTHPDRRRTGSRKPPARGSGPRCRCCRWLRAHTGIRRSQPGVAERGWLWGLGSSVERVLVFLQPLARALHAKSRPVAAHRDGDYLNRRILTAARGTPRQSGRCLSRSVAAAVGRARLQKEELSSLAGASSNRGHAAAA